MCVENEWERRREDMKCSVVYCSEIRDIDNSNINSYYQTIVVYMPVKITPIIIITIRLITPIKQHLQYQYQK